jgi:hypothetical protein
MPILSGFSAAALLADALLGSLVISIDAATAYGATSGEPVVTIPHEYDNLNFDGKSAFRSAALIAASVACPRSKETSSR